MATITATPAKLSDGTWGAKLTGAKNAYKGMSIKVRTRSGQTWTTTVTGVWGQERDGILVRTNSADKPASPKRTSKPRRTTRTGCRCGSVEEYTKRTDCWTCAHDAL